jgi:hypothetical protein
VTEAEARATVRLLREKLSRGASIRAAAAEIGKPRSTLHRLAVARNVPRRRWHLSPEMVRQVNRSIDLEESLRVIARLHQIDAAGVSRRRKARLQARGEPVRVAPYKCPRGHTTTLQPCVACQAMDAGTSQRPEHRS